MKPAHFFWLWIGCVWMLSDHCHADRIILANKPPVSGRITAETTDRITIDTVNGRFTFSRSQILDVQRDSIDVNHMLDAETYLQQGYLEAAITTLASADLLNSMLSDRLHHILIANLAENAHGVVATSATTSLLIEKLQMSPTKPPELLLLYTALAADTDSFSTAQTLINEFPLSPSPRLKWPEKTLDGLLDRISYQAQKYDNGPLLAAVATVAATLGSTNGSVGTGGVLTVYAQINASISSRNYLEAATGFSPELFLHRSDLFTPLAEKLLYTILSAKPGSQIIAALQSAKITVLPYMNERLQMRTLKELAKMLLQTNRIDEAQRLAESVSESNADQGAILTHLVTFHKRHAHLPQESQLETYKLASWAKDMGLLDEARALFLNLRSDARFTEVVSVQLEILEHRMATDELRYLRSLYNLGRYKELQVEADRFTQKHYPTTYNQEALALVQLVDFEKWSQQRTSHDVGEAEYQQAERHANRGEYDQALMYLNRVQLDHQNSLAAEKTRNLRERVMREKAAAQRQITPPGSTP